jgi:hypothetical protein
MTDAQLQAFLTGSRKASWEQVAGLIKKHGPIRTDQIARSMGKGLNVISGRISELYDEGCISAEGTEQGYTVWCWEADPNRWQHLKALRAAQKLKSKLERFADNPGLSTAFRASCKAELARLELYIQESGNIDI